MRGNLLSLSEQVDRLAESLGEGNYRVGTGLPLIDMLCGGPAPGEIFTIVGRSFVGKSLIAQNIVYNNREKPSIFFSLEMPTNQALIRLYALWKDENAEHLQRRIDEGDMPLDFWDMEQEFPYHRIVGEQGVTIERMTDYVNAFRHDLQMNPAFVVIDYLELVNNAKTSGEGYLATESTITALKSWAVEENLRVFLIHQANKSEPSWLPPTEDSPRNGGYTESDFMVGAWRPHMNPEMAPGERRYYKDKINFNVIKNRAYFKLAEEITMKISPSLRLVGQYERTKHDEQSAEEAQELMRTWQTIEADT